MKSSVVTIKELSFLTGYSISTVSKALNNKSDISKATRDTIKTIAKQYNYVPNNYAVSLRIGGVDCIAVILPELTQTHFSQSLSYLQCLAESHGYRILFYQSFYSYQKELKYIKNLCDGSIEGIILMSNKSKKYSQYKSCSFPIVSLKINTSHTIDEIKQRSHATFTKLFKS